MSKLHTDEAKILDSGSRREFKSGAVRDIVDGKGRFDLVPLKELADVISSTHKNCGAIIKSIGCFCDTGDDECLIDAINQFSDKFSDGDIFTVALEVAKHYEEGCKKYGERNWEKGIPLHCYIDSGVRHLMKYWRGDTDEPHGRAFIWNMLGAMWTMKNTPSMIDISFKK